MRYRIPWRHDLLRCHLLCLLLSTVIFVAPVAADSRSEFKALYIRLLDLEAKLTEHKNASNAEVSPEANKELQAAQEALDQAFLGHPKTTELSKALTTARAALASSKNANDAAAMYRYRKEVSTLSEKLETLQGLIPELQAPLHRLAEAVRQVERSRLAQDPEGLQLQDTVHGLRQRLATLKADIESAKRRP